ncbi:MAG: 5-formyltetrahydrofolate cyclo-ligase [Pseudomonadota bacterium]
MDKQSQKAQLRSHSLKQRDAIPVDRRIEMSIEAAEIGKKNIEFDPGTVVSGFFPIRSEIDPRPLMDGLREKGARLCLPVVMDKTTIVFRELIRGAELIDTGFGTRGPAEDAEVLDPHLLIMPLSVFDHHGGRVGYGAGHYDRAIAKILEKGISPRLIGMAFDCQLAETVPVEPHDQPLDAMLTESGFYPAKVAAK